MTEEDWNWAAVVAFARNHRNRLIAAVVVASLLTLFITGSSSGPLFLVLLPLVLGSAVVLVESPRLIEWIDGWENGFERAHTWAEPRPGRFARYFVVPLARGSNWLWNTTEPVTDRNVRSALRVTAIAYLWAAMFGVLVAAIYIVVVLVLIVLGIVVIGWIMSNMGSDGHSITESMDRRFWARAGSSGAKLYKKTGMFSEEETGRVDEAGRVYKKTGIFSEEEVGRVDKSGRVYEKTGMFSEDETHRIDSDNHVFRKTGIFSEEEVGRTDEDGNVYKKTGLFSEEQIGRVRKD
jgi:hypothetical protein